MNSELSQSISVAMATYNGERFIRAQLDSIASQTLLPCELIITDDGSSDNTCTIINDFAQHSPFPVKLYQNTKRLGYRDNFIRAAYLCTGHLVAFCDQDDIWHSDKLRLQQLYFDDPEVALVTHPYQIMDAEGRITNHIFPRVKRVTKYRPTTFNVFFTYYGMTLLFRKAILPPEECIDTRPIDHSTFKDLMSHDQWIPFLASSCYTTVFLPNALTFYRQHGSNTCGPQLKRTIFNRIINLAFTRSPITDMNLYRNYCCSLLSMIKALKVGCVSCNSISQDGANKAIMFYESLYERYRRRGDINDFSISRKERLTLFIKALLTGSYGRKMGGGFGVSGAVKDLIRILFCGPKR